MWESDDAQSCNFIPVEDFVDDFEKLDIKVTSQSADFCLLQQGVSCTCRRVVRFCFRIFSFHLAEDGHLKFLLNTISLIHVTKGVLPVVEVDHANVVVELESELAVLFMHFFRQLTGRHEIKLLDHCMSFVNAHNQGLSPNRETTVMRM